ncbi:MAG: DUF362 domain-containing protein [Phycisphaerales bacterium]|nr:DUF362 domain-containing protein [Phycisphaerales bacterium]
MKAKQPNQDNQPEASREWTRRDLLVRGGQTAAVAGLAAGAAWYLHDPRGDAGLQLPEPIHLKDYFANVDFPVDRPRISVAWGALETIERMVQAAVEGLHPEGMKGFVSRGDVVLLKPNVGFDRGPELGATTNPMVVAAVARLCREAGARKVIVADNPIENPGACFAKSGIKTAAETAGASVMIHSNAHDAMVAVRDREPDPAKQEALGVWPIFWKPLKEADKVIGIAPVKDHNLCHASMAMKNWYGLLGGRRNQFHQAIHNIVSDLGFMMRPTLVIADGIRVMMRNGPTGGRLEDLAIGGVTGRPVVVASVDQLACDGWCFENLLGRDPAVLAYLDLAWEKFGHDPARLVARSWREYEQQGKIIEQDA